MKGFKDSTKTMSGHGASAGKALSGLKNRPIGKPIGFAEGGRVSALADIESSNYKVLRKKGFSDAEAKDMAQNGRRGPAMDDVERSNFDVLRKKGFSASEADDMARNSKPSKGVPVDSRTPLIKPRW